MATETGLSFAIDLSELKTFASQLRKAEPRLYRSFRVSLAEAAEVVADRAREIASEQSSSIPPTISVRVSGVAVYVGAGSPSVPLAGLYEVGNAKSGRLVGSSGGRTFRHPVFGDNDNWVSQPRFPFLRRAADESEPVVLERTVFAVQTVLQDVLRTMP